MAIPRSHYHPYSFIVFLHYSLSRLGLWHVLIRRQLSTTFFFLFVLRTSTSTIVYHFMFFWGGVSYKDNANIFFYLAQFQFRISEHRRNKSNRTTMRPLGIYFIGISIYILNMIHFLMISGDFGVFSFQLMDIRTYGRTDPLIDMRGHI